MSALRERLASVPTQRSTASRLQPPALSVLDAHLQAQLAGIQDTRRVLFLEVKTVPVSERASARWHAVGATFRDLCEWKGDALRAGPRVLRLSLASATLQEANQRLGIDQEKRLSLLRSLEMLRRSLEDQLLEIELMSPEMYLTELRARNPGMDPPEHLAEAAKEMAAEVLRAWLSLVKEFHTATISPFDARVLNISALVAEAQHRHIHPVWVLAKQPVIGAVSRAAVPRVPVAVPSADTKPGSAA